MTPKEKAQELIDKFREYGELAESHWANGTEKDLALICVGEMVTLLTMQKERHNTHTINDIEFLEDVKDEINYGNN